jgi:hypothetical protein
MRREEGRIPSLASVDGYLGRRIDVSLEKVDFDDAGKGSSLALKCRRQTVSLFVLVETNGSLQYTSESISKAISAGDVRHS